MWRARGGAEFGVAVPLLFFFCSVFFTTPCSSAGADARRRISVGRPTTVAKTAKFAGEVGSYTLAAAKNHLYYSYAAYCPIKTGGVDSWNCIWCNHTNERLIVTQTFSNAETNTFGYAGVTETGSAIHVMFRGTESTSLRNWITNLDASKLTAYPNVPGAKVHKGFYDAYSDLSGAVRAAATALTSKYPRARVYVGGHSLGAALSVFAAIDLVDFLGLSGVQVWNFGDPRCGNEDFAWYFGNSTGIDASWRSVNQKDIVPHLPIRLMGFHHVAREVWYPSTDYEDFIVCDGSGEDPKCSDSVVGDSVTDHLTYLGVDERDGKPYGC